MPRQQPDSATTFSDGSESEHDASSIQRLRFRITDEPPLYQIDLSLSPSARYSQICEDFKHEMAELVGIYDTLLSYTPAPRVFAYLARSFLKRVFSEEETQEIQGISKATSIPLHLVVAYNTFLDLFSGCMSGGVQVKTPRVRATRMIHFRNLDWDMDPLRDMIIRVEYVLGGKVVARSVTYAGYVGVLTGVREGLSMSMNYRARVDSRSSTLMNRFHHLSLLLGRRPSIASQLRQLLLKPGPPPTLDTLTHRFLNTKASSCYLTFCTPSSVLIVEKDLSSAVVHTSDAFLAVTNHDVAMEAWTPDHWHKFLEKAVGPELGGAKDIMEDSMERKQCICKMWHAKGDEKVVIDEVKEWLRKYPIRNECTHYSCIMDPSAPGGGLVWLETCEVE